MRYPNEGTFCFVDEGVRLEPLKDERLGTTLVGRYLIEEVIGEGGMATVYRARNKLIERHCAVKIMNPMLATDTVVRERFRREAKNAQKLSHPNIIEIYDQGDTEDGTAYIAMELLRGQALAEVIAHDAIDIPRAVGFMIQIARGIARAHDLEVIHRDLKPENIYICTREPQMNGANGFGTLNETGELVKLLDFGIARSRSDSRLTGAGELFGTPQYMAPERISHGESGASVDLYALGVIFFEMVTKRLPFDAPDIATFFVKHLNEPPPSPRSINRQVPQALDQLILRLLAKQPKERPVDAHRVHQDLREIANSGDFIIPPQPESDVVTSISMPRTREGARAPDGWTRRSKVYEQMLSRAYGNKPPSEMARMLAEVNQLSRRIHDLRSYALADQHKLEDIDQRGRDGRQRFGFAVDALGNDASKARDEARVSRAMAGILTEERVQMRQRFVAAHKEITMWEGRSGFTEPYQDLADAYRSAADAIEAWMAVRDEEARALEAANVNSRAVTDLEFQIAELRTRLAQHEADIEAERAVCEKSIIDKSKQSDDLEQELSSLTKRFCEPLRTRPELAPLFKQLESEAAA
jgi:serine/threonine-protein kinase